MGYMIKGVPAYIQTGPTLCAFYASAMMIKYFGGSPVWPSGWGPTGQFTGFRLTQKNNGIILTRQFYALANANKLVAITPGSKFYEVGDVEALLKQRGPVVACVDFTKFMIGGSGHCITVIGTDGDDIIYRCPSDGKKHPMRFSRITECCDGFMAITANGETAGSEIKW
jgi:hypothetical protein